MEAEFVDPEELGDEAGVDGSPDLSNIPEHVRALMGSDPSQRDDDSEEVQDEEEVEDQEEEEAEDDEVLEADDSDDDEDDDDQPEDRYEAEKRGILADLAREREARRQYQQLVEQMSTQWQQQPQQEEENIPDKDESPIDWLEYQQRRSTQNIESKLSQFEQYQQAQAQQEAAKQFFTVLDKANQEFVKESPDYEDALNHARRVRISQYKAFGMPEDQAKQMLQQEEILFAAQKFQEGQNPAKAAYELARELGYRPKKKVADTESTSGREKARVQKKAQRTKSLSSMPGESSGSAGKVTLKTFRNLPHEDQISMLQKHPDLYKQFQANSGVAYLG